MDMLHCHIPNTYSRLLYSILLRSTVSRAALDVTVSRLSGKSIDDEHGESGKTKYDITGYDNVMFMKYREQCLANNSSYKTGSLFLVGPASIID